MKKAPKKFSTKSTRTVFQRPRKLPLATSSKAAKTEKPEKKKYPSISRMIPEDWMLFSGEKLSIIRDHWQIIFVSFISGVLLMAIAVKGLDLRSNWQELEKRDSLRVELTGKKEYWEGVVRKYPDYKDAYFQLAILAYQLGEKEEAKQAITKVLELDPNDSTGRELARKMER